MKIHVTKPFLPPRADYERLVDQIWHHVWLTNSGPLLNLLEYDLRQALNVPFLHPVTNGTMALQLAIRACALSGEVITTPFSYVATCSALLWEHCTPVMVDIEPGGLTLDPVAAEAAITDKTSAILATHVFGNPCDIEALEDIGRRHGIKVIYDAAHCFGVTYNGRSLLGFGDCAATSFHATKLFQTGEGGALVTHDPQIAERAQWLGNFGHDGPHAFRGVGINAKMSEFQAAMGLAVLPHMPDLIAKLTRIAGWYRDGLADARVSFQRIRAGTEYTHAYQPVIFDSEPDLIRAMKALEARDVVPRRYFYPALSQLPFVTARHPVPVAESVATRVLCLPMHHDLTQAQVGLICDTVKTVAGR